MKSIRDAMRKRMLYVVTFVTYYKLPKNCFHFLLKLKTNALLQRRLVTDAKKKTVIRQLSTVVTRLGYRMEVDKPVALTIFPVLRLIVLFYYV